MAQPTLIPNCDGARFESLPLDAPRNRCILALDLGTATGWAIRGHDGLITSGTVSLRPGRFDGGGMRYLRFTNWLTEVDRLSGPVAAIWFEEVRRHAGTDASHIYGGLMATLTAWAELRGVPYEGVPVGTIKRHATSKGNDRYAGFNMLAADSASSWHHIVAVSDGAANKTFVYLDGALKGNADRSTGETIYTVGNHSNGGQRFAEYIDDVRVYGGTLTQADVTAIYGGDHGDVVTGTIVVEDPGNNGPVLFWGDKSGKGNHANSTNLGTSNREPQLKTNQQNGMPAIYFNDDYLALTTTTATPSTRSRASPCSW